MYALNTALTCISGFRCICEPGFTGKNCEMVYVPCDPSPCMNNGRCMQIDDLNYECKCKSGTFAFTSKPDHRRSVIITHYGGVRYILYTGFIIFYKHGVFRLLRWTSKCYYVITLGPCLKTPGTYFGVYTR